MSSASLSGKVPGWVSLQAWIHWGTAGIWLLLWALLGRQPSFLSPLGVHILLLVFPSWVSETEQTPLAHGRGDEQLWLPGNQPRGTSILRARGTCPGAGVTDQLASHTETLGQNSGFSSTSHGVCVRTPYLPRPI